MAKMFYTLEEAASKLGVSEDEIKNMASAGKVQQFRDRDRLMFKRDQIDSLAGSAEDSDAGIPALSSGDTDAIDLSSSGVSEPPRREDPRAATGISVFDAGEIDAADPMAQTQVTDGMSMGDDDLALDSVGSGSGLLDLTRESDDTSLGAELLDEIYPGGEASDAALAEPTSSGVLDGGLGGASSGSGLDNLQPVMDDQYATIAAVPGEAFDGGGSGLSIGFLFGAIVALVLTAFVAASMIMGKSIQLTHALAGEPENSMLLVYCGGLLVLSIVLGAIGYFVGKSRG